MKKALRVLGFALSAVFLAAQFIRPQRNAGVAEGPDSLVRRHAVPDDVRDLLRRACYDCHSDATQYPWYASVQPLAWWIERHVVDGKAELNFSAFGAYSAKRASRKLVETADEVREGHMPLKSYRALHPEARLAAAEIARLTDWAETLADELEPE